MKLVSDSPEPKKTAKKVKKDKKPKGEREEALEAVLKKPRTRAVSLTLSENGIDEDMQQLSSNGKHSPEKQKSEKKVKKEKKEKSKKDKTKSESDAEEVDADGVPAKHADGKFSNFPIRESTIKKLHAKGVKYLFPIQVQTFRKVLKGEDVIAKARTGTGKTLAFALPLIEKLESAPGNKARGRPPRVIVLAPTRELVNQVANDFKALSNLSVHAFYGGVGYHGQRDAMRNGIDILVGTPGRLLDWVNQQQLDTSKLEHVVLDEVDQMLDMGFANDVEAIISHSYKKEEDTNPQTLLFSATLPSWVMKTARQYMKNMPEVVDLVGNSANQSATNVTHIAMKSFWKDRANHVSRIIQFYSGDNGRAMVFCETKKDVDSLSVCKEITQSKEKLHGDVKQASREQVLQGFRDGSIKVLITTNVAARGLDIPEVDLVIQCNPPTDIDSYIHRSGRTGRAGKSGVSVCLYSGRNEQDLIRVERFAKLSFQRKAIPTSDDISARGMKDLSGTLEAVEDAALEKFMPAAEELVAEKGAVKAVATLFAILMKHTKVKSTSLLSSREGFVTYLYRTNATIRFKGYLHTVIKTRGCDDQKISNVTLTLDRKGAAFDIAEEDVANIESTLLFESHNDSITRATTLPPLEPEVSSGGHGGGGNRFGGGGWGGNRNGGGRNNYGGGGFRGMKRSFGGDYSNGGSPANKVKKFD